MDIGPHFVLIIAPNLRTLNQAQTSKYRCGTCSHLIAIELLKVPKRALTEQHYFDEILKNVTKLILLGQGLFWTWDGFIVIKWLS